MRRRPDSTGANGPAFSAPETHGRLKGPWVSWGSGRRWAVPRRVGVKGSGGAQDCGAGSEGTPCPRTAASRDPPSPHRPGWLWVWTFRCLGGVDARLQTHRAASAKASAAATNAGAAASGPQPYHPPSPLSSEPGGKAGALLVLRTNRQAQDEDGLKNRPIVMKKK